MSKLGVRMDQFAVPLSATQTATNRWNISTSDKAEEIGKLQQNGVGRWTYTFRRHKLRRGFFFTNRTQALTALAQDEAAYRQEFNTIRAPITGTGKVEYTPWKSRGWPGGLIGQKRYRHLMTREQRDALVEQQRARRASAR